MKKESDNLKIGLIAGFYAVLFLGLSSLLSIWLIHPIHTYWDYAGYIAFNQKTSGFKLVVSIIIQFFFTFQLAVIYPYFADIIKTKLYLIRGIVYGGSIWFFIQGILFIFQIIKLEKNEPGEIVWEFLTAIIFGMIVSWITEKKKG